MEEEPVTIEMPATVTWPDVSSVGLAELLGALSQALDITEGQPAGHCARCCYIGVRIGGAHHERLDGKGYPRGITESDITLETRIVTTADFFDALTADRPYRAAMPVSRALAIMDEAVGTAIDPSCLAALKQALARVESMVA